MNWGTKIVLGMSIFMLFIITLVVLMFKAQSNDSLIEEDYYEKGIEYDVQYNAKRNVYLDNASPNIELLNNSIKIKLKEEAIYKLKLIRPSNSKLDISLNGKTEGLENEINIDRQQLEKGLWSLRIEWNSKGKDYLYIKDVML